MKPILALVTIIALLIGMLDNIISRGSWFEFAVLISLMYFVSTGTQE